MGEKVTNAALLQIAHDRLYPRLTNHSYLIRRKRREILSTWMEKIEDDTLTVLDIGGRYQPYRPLLGNRIKRYFAVDVIPTPLVNVIAQGQRLPFKDESFDLVIATGVFEFFPEPRAAADEILRVLKPNGHLIVSVTAIAPRAVNEEHWRYLPAGLRFALGSFPKVEVVAEGSTIGGFFRLVAWSSEIFAKFGFVRRVFRCTLIPGLNLAGLLLDRAGVTSNDQVSGAFSALAQKGKHRPSTNHSQVGLTLSSAVWAVLRQGNASSRRKNEASRAFNSHSFHDPILGIGDLVRIGRLRPNIKGGHKIRSPGAERETIRLPDH